MEKKVIYILSNGKVAAIDKSNGAITWEVNLKEYAGMKVKSIGQIMHDGDKLYIGCAGILICLAAKDGSLIWKNELKGWGYNFISIANTDAITSGASAYNAAAAQVASTATIAGVTAATV